MFVNGVQKFFTYAGHYSCESARESVRIVERLMRHMPKESGAYWFEVMERSYRIAMLVCLIPITVMLAPFSLGCYTLASLTDKGQFELIDAGHGTSLLDKKVKVLSLNACFQDPWSPLTGGVRTPFERMAPGGDRLSMLAYKIAKQRPTVFLGQEFDNLGAQDAFIHQMKEYGFRYFLRDVGPTLGNHSGLFVASKVPMKNVKFVPYPLQDRAGLAKLAGQGALAFTVSVGGQDLQLVNVHLNYGDGAAIQAARGRQLTRHVAPLLTQQKSALFGDLNFDTAVHRIESVAGPLKGFVNAFEGQVSCTDEGKHTLRGKSLTPGGKPCTDCKERVDGLIYDPKQVQVHNPHLKQLRSKGELLSDHSAMIATFA
jgi:endonuclease/exonuclease/phosphatase family metal-dependent hydrolase